ncbi:MAG TPA: hypothetical protein VFS77_22190 [Pyrinomonadaceae bacterium]|nr:hypothetical protein [Pyrinomonadaceae bacterium]
MTTTTNLGITHIDSAQNQGGVTANLALDKLDKRAGELTIVMADADITLTEAQWIYGTLRFTGTNGAARNINVPDDRKMSWTIVNDTVGGFGLVIRNNVGSPTDTGVTVANARTAIVRGDGDVVKRVTADVAH